MHRLWMLCALGLIFLPACQKVPDRTPTTEDAGEPAFGDVLVIGTEADADALTPLVSMANTGSDVWSLLFCQLARIKPNMRDFDPWLATRWEFSPDRENLTFYLRDDVTWHDGVKLSAYDVEFSFSLYKNEAVGWKSIRWLEHIESVTAVDSFTVRFEYRKVYPDQFLDAWIFCPLPKHILEDVPVDEIRTHEYHRKPVGCGPFVFDEWIPQQKIELVANESYFLGRPYLDRLVWKIVPDYTSLATQLGRGQIDLWPVVPADQVTRLKEMPNLDIQRYPSRAYHYIVWQIADPLFTSREVRRALTMAVDHQKIIDSLLNGMARPALGPIPPFLWAHDPDLRQIVFDPYEAKKLLALEGWDDTDGDGWLDKDGRRFEFELITNADNQLRSDVTVVIQDDLKRIGVKVNPRLVEWTVFVERLTRKKDFQAAVSAWSTAVKVDLTTMWHSKSIEDKFNLGHYANPRVDRLIEQARVELDRGEAGKLWSQAQQLIIDDAPYTFLFVTDEVIAVDRRLRNAHPTTFAWNYNIARWWVPAAEQRYKSW